MKYLKLLVTCILMLSMHSALAGQWHYVNPATTESIAKETVAPEKVTMQSTLQVAAQPEKRDVEPVPVNNMSMDVVRTRFGQPNSEGTPVGQPPINRWYYDQYTVYFEFDRVIISVVN